MSKKSTSSKNNIFTTIGKEILRLEFKTDSGRVNVFALVILGLFSVFITGKDWILKLVHLIGSFVVEYMGGQPTSIEYETTNSLTMIIIFLAASVLCVSAIYCLDRNLKKAKNEGTEDESD